MYNSVLIYHLLYLGYQHIYSSYNSNTCFMFAKIQLIACLLTYIAVTYIYTYNSVYFWYTVGLLMNSYLLIPDMTHAVFWAHLNHHGWVCCCSGRSPFSSCIMISLLECFPTLKLKIEKDNEANRLCNNCRVQHPH